MTDLLLLLPNFPSASFSRLLPVIERHGLSTTDLLVLDAPQIASRTKLPLLDVKRLCAAIVHHLQRDVALPPNHYTPPEPDPNLRADSDVRAEDSCRGLPTGTDGPGEEPGEEDAAEPPDPSPTATSPSLDSLFRPWSTISTLDDTLDSALDGGVPAGYVTEVTGESGAGKTQFLLSLLLAVQLPPPRGLGRPALYISTEAPLSTRRLKQILDTHPYISSLAPSERPTLDAVVSAATPDLESQDHILQFQVPVEVRRRNIGLIILDSVAANYRAEFDRGATRATQGSSMAARGVELASLGGLLRDLARQHNLAVVVANQVADRFAPIPTPAATFPSTHSTSQLTQESPLASRSRPPHNHVPSPSNKENDLPQPSPSLPGPPFSSSALHFQSPPAIQLDHQQRFFSGWGDDPFTTTSLKTPSLGLVWTTQLACRIALLKQAIYMAPPSAPTATALPVDENGDSYERDVASAQYSWRRWMKVVFAPHVRASGLDMEECVEFEITAGGLQGVVHGGRDQK